MVGRVILVNLMLLIAGVDEGRRHCRDRPAFDAFFRVSLVSTNLHITEKENEI
jgi:hypothetical protein